MEAKGHASGVTLGRSPRMLSARRIVARGGGARTRRRGEAEHARSLRRGRASAPASPAPPAEPFRAEGVRAQLKTRLPPGSARPAPRWSASAGMDGQW